ncbi:hypothetical protein [Cyanobium sp. N5-Cardenillas]|uniref:hypothetical protein n=1 Tax=Cyanobium sp. N5-Cardenillas TaxID=2823720 RepID=UPI0039656A05
MLNQELPPTPGGPVRGTGNQPLWREWHGLELGKPDWASWSHCLAWSLHDASIGPLIWCGMNAYYQPMQFALPAQPAGWRRVIDTAIPGGHDLPATPEPWLPSTAPLESRSLMLLVAAPLLEKTQVETPPRAKAATGKKKAGGGNRTRIISLEG